MDQGSSEISMTARAAAVAALVAATAVLLVALAGALSNGGGGPTPDAPGNGSSVSGNASRAKSGPATYTIEEGDTLSAIAAETGVSIARIEDLNPGLDPQAITTGQEIRLK
jgi:LysM repeat protein